MLRRYRLELLLILAVAMLVGQLAWPAVVRWWRRPTAGRVGVDSCQIAGLGPEFLIYLPSDYGNSALPLVVFLHGSAECGTDASVLRGQGPLSAVEDDLSFPAIVAVPQCLPHTSWRPKGLNQFVEQVTDSYRVDRDRIYLIGYSMGGRGTWHTAAAYPNTFAAIVPIASGGDANQAARFVNIPIWAFHGAHDEIVPVTGSEQMIEAIRAAGGTPQLTILPNAGHGIRDEVCRRPELWSWLFAQKRPPQDGR